MPPAEDLFDRLPDELLCQVLCKVGPFHQLHQSCSSVSRRWNKLCKSVDVLHFDCAFLQRRFKCRPLSERLFMLEGLIGSVIRANSGTGIRNLVICGPNFSFGALHIWLRSTRSTLEVLSLENELSTGESGILAGDKFVELFSCKNLKFLELSNWLFTNLSTLKAVCSTGGGGTLSNLTSCRLKGIVMNDEALKTIVELCPVLRSIILESCEGLDSPTISSDALKELSFEYLSYDLEFQKCLKNLTVNSQSLESAAIKCVSQLTGAMPALRELTLHSGCKIQAQVDQLHSLTLKSSPAFSWNVGAVLSTISTVAELEVKKVSVVAKVLGNVKEVIVPFFKCIGHCEELEVGGDIFEYFCREVIYGRAELLPLPFMKTIRVYMKAIDERSIQVLSVLASNCGSLETIECFTKLEGDGVSLLAFQKSVNHVQVSCCRQE